MRERSPVQQRALDLAIETIDGQRTTDPKSWLFDVLDLAWLCATWGDDEGLAAATARALSAVEQIIDPKERDDELSRIAHVLQAGGRSEQALDVIESINDDEACQEALEYAVVSAAKDGDRTGAAAALQRLPEPSTDLLAALAAAEGGDHKKVEAAFRQLAGEEITLAVARAWQARDLEQVSALVQPFFRMKREDAISSAARGALDAGHYDLARWLWGQSRTENPYLIDWSVDHAIAYAAAANGDAPVAEEALTRVTDPDRRASVLCELGRRQIGAGDYDVALKSLRAACALIDRIEEKALRQERAKDVAEQLSRAGAADEALALAPLCGHGRAELLFGIACGQARRGDYDAADATRRLIPAGDVFADYCTAHIVAARVGAGDAPPSRLGQIASPTLRGDMAREAARHAHDRGESDRVKELLAFARAAALMAEEHERDTGLANVASDEIELGCLEGARQTVARIKHRETQVEQSASLAAALVRAGDREQGGQVFAGALAIAREPLSAKLCGVIAGYMVSAGLLDAALEVAAALPRATKGSKRTRNEILRRAALACARSGAGERALDLAGGIRGLREKARAYLDIAAPECCC